MTAPSAIKADSTSSQGDYLGHQRIYQTGIFHSETVFNPKHILLLEKTSKRRTVARSFKERDKHCTNRSFFLESSDHLLKSFTLLLSI